MRDFEGLVFRVVGWQHAIHNTLGAAEREVAVQLHHGHILRYEVRTVDLDFVVALGERTRGAAQADDNGNQMTQKTLPSAVVFSALSIL